MANTRVVKSFIRSLSKLGKSDTIDAQGLARYAKERHEELKLYKPNSDADKELLELTNRKTELKHMLVQEKNRLQAPNNKYCKSSNTTVIKLLQNELDRLKKPQKELIDKMYN
jgi:transposase